MTLLLFLRAWPHEALLRIDDLGSQINTVLVRMQAPVSFYGFTILIMGDEIFGIFGEVVASIVGHLVRGRFEDDLDLELVNIFHGRWVR